MTLRGLVVVGCFNAGGAIYFKVFLNLTYDAFFMIIVFKLNKLNELYLKTCLILAGCKIILFNFM